MKVLFAGYGSIARRHISNLRTICDEKRESLEIDLLRHSLSGRPEGIRSVFVDPVSIGETYDAVFVTNPTSMHYETLVNLVDKGDAFFVEKPVFDHSDVNLAPFVNERKMFHVACPLRFTKVLRWVRENIDPSQILSVRCISSSYLPEWRPGIDYRDTYSAHADMGGGVQIDLIHELDYVCALLGTPRSVEAIMGKISDLEIDSNDIALYIADFGGKTAEIHVDYFGRAPLRRLEIFTLTETYLCDLIESRICALRQQATVDLAEERDDFQRRELEYFLDCVSSGTHSENGIKEATDILRIAEGGWTK